ncbi:3'-5' exoribonuclease [Coraliomargarita sp. SDUM461003]|uniref:3'-5' exoribonuclease n=1 Tax=Thalassobacterium maritimum TaxID=3041265 RepID=A0ABU1AT84_9BACT|nr:3'-5' exonuclease [Coraliomargarita sp. SDUM461003]MDQ8206197.1 3'-5' exoribonuclease [Coraliomargarita sp. SDUM461003]
MRYSDLSLDIETLDTVPGGLICSVGAVPFNARGVSSDAGFLLRVSIVDGLRLGLSVDSSTLEWWGQQSAVARAGLENGAVCVCVADLFERLGEFVDAYCDRDTVRVWTKGPGFDSAFLAVAARRVEKSLPWKFWNDRCVRTICEGVSAPKRGADNVHHNALDDAIYQARWVRAARRLKSVNL